MGFEPVPVGVWKAGVPLGEMDCSLDGSGKLRLRQADLAKVNIQDAAVLLADADTLRLALRRPRANEVKLVRTVRPVLDKRGQPTANRDVNATVGIRALNLEPKACRGRHKLDRKDDLLILNLVRTESAGKAAERDAEE